jgi:hypothetical protein
MGEIQSSGETRRLLLLKRDPWSAAPHAHPLYVLARLLRHLGPATAPQPIIVWQCEWPCVWRWRALTLGQRALREG